MIQVVTMVFEVHDRFLLGGCNVAAKQLLGCLGWLLKRVARGDLGGCYGIC